MHKMMSVRGAQQNAWAPGEDEQDQAASEAASVDQPLSISRRGKGGLYPRTSEPKPVGTGFPAVDFGNSSALGGFFYQEEEEEEEEEEDIYNTEELEVVRMIRLSREEEKEKPPTWGGIGDTLSLHVPTQVILWILLAAVVYFIMRGATRGEEKQKSLELHRGVLKTTIESLVRGKKEKQGLRKQRDALMRHRTVLLREAIGVQAELASMLSEIQQAGTLKWVDGDGEDQRGAEGEPKESGDSPSTGTGYQVTGITLPGLDSGPVSLNKELHELIFNQGDTVFQESAIAQLVKELRGKIGLRGRDEYRGRKWGEKKQIGSMPLDEVEQWFVTTAESLGVSWGVVSGPPPSQKMHKAETVQEGGAPRARTMRDRAMGLLGLASAMLRRKMSLESELEDILEQTSHFSAAQKAALAEIVSASKDLKNMVSHWHTRLEAAFGTVSGFLDESDFAADISEAVRYVYTSAMSTKDLLEKLTSFGGEDCQVSSEDMEKASETRFKLLQMRQQAKKLLVEISEQLVESSVTGAHSQTDQAEMLVYDLHKKKGTINSAPLKEKAQTLSAQLEQTDRWLQKAMEIFRNM
ncbi:hypothetical protein Esti_006369 [Eimeria stiedai]